MIAKRYMHLSGATSKDFGAVSVADRKHAAKNPKAYFYEKPITIEDHQNSRWIAEPLRLLDCCQETDGGVALVVTSRRAGQGSQAPARRSSRRRRRASSPDQYSMVSYYRPELGLPEMGLVGRQLWAQSGLKPDRHPDRDPLRPLHPVHADSARGVGLLRPGRGQGLHRRRRDRDRRPAADQHPRRPAGRGLHPRHERHRRGRAPAARHVGQPGRRRRACARHRRHRGARPRA